MSEDLLTADHVRRALEPHGLRVVELPADTSTALLAAAALNTTVDTIVKSLLFVTDNDAPILALTSGDKRVSSGKLAAEVGTGKVRLAKPQEVQHISGYAIGGVPPIGHREPIRTFIDRHLLEHATVFAAAGTRFAVFPVSPSQLEAITRGTVADITE